jgi:putative transposase
MGLARSTYYDEIKGQPIEEGRLMAHITEICAEFPRYGYRRITAQLCEDGIIVNHKKVMRLMKEHGLTVQPRRRYVVTTDSDHVPSWQNTGSGGQWGGAGILSITVGRYSRT